MKNTTIAVLGAGSWGTALAILLARNGVKVFLWGNEPDHIATLSTERSNEAFLPGIPFPELLQPVDNLSEAIANSDDVLIVVPSSAFRSVLQQISTSLKPTMHVIWATKGLEEGTGKLLHENIEEILGADCGYAVISGPTFAQEVARGLPTAITVASKDTDFAASLAGLLCNDSFRAYTTDDVVAVELGGAVKNVLAIAAGIADGLGFGSNTRAALITRGLTEIMRLGHALGGRQETFMGLTGLGDLVLTCTDDQSRNRRFGLALAKGNNCKLALAEIGQVVEGIQTAREVVRLAEKMNVEMPITQQIYRVLYEGVNPRDAVQELFARDLKPESI